MTRQVHAMIQGKASTSLNIGFSDTKQKTRDDMGTGKRVNPAAVVGENCRRSNPCRVLTALPDRGPSSNFLPSIH